MTVSTEKIWFGAAHQVDHEPFSWRRPVILALAVMALVALRCCLPFQMTDSMLVYERLAEAVLGQQNWGKQALVGAVEYPPLPALCLLLLSPIRHLLPCAPGNLMVAVAQIWVLSYLWRLARLAAGQRRWAVWLLAPVALLALLVRPDLPGWGLSNPRLWLIWQADPQWINAVPLASLLYHLWRWDHSEELRDLAILACNAALLVFVGLPGLLLAVLILLALWLRGTTIQTRGPGGATLLWLPLLYAVILLPLANWLVMGDAWFWLRRLLPNLAQMPPGAWWPRATWHAWGLALTLGLLAIGTLWRGLPRRWYLAWLLIPAQGILLNLGQSAELHLGPEQLLGTLLAPPLILTCLAPSSGGLKGGRAWLAALLSLPFILFSLHWRGPAGTREAFTPGAPPPPASDLLAQVDQHWADSRILIFDLRTAVTYAHQDTQRFVARLDFHEAEVLDFKEREQLHLLLAPNDGRFQPRQHGVLARLHDRGAPWLFLEREWPGGWQLWRCVRPPPVTPATASEPAPVPGPATVPEPTPVVPPAPPAKDSPPPPT